jgi:hypothetical protein
MELTKKLKEMGEQLENQLAEYQLQVEQTQKMARDIEAGICNNLEKDQGMTVVRESQDGSLESKFLDLQRETSQFDRGMDQLMKRHQEEAKKANPKCKLEDSNLSLTKYVD